MATLTGKTIASTYKDLLQISNSNSGIDGTKRAISDGEATASPLELSSTAVNISSGFELGGVAVSATAAELDYNNIATLGDVEASKTVTADASGNVNFATGGVLQWNATDKLTHSANTMTLSGFTTFDMGAVTTLDFDGSIDFTTASNGDITFNPNGTGRVGIGTTNPSETLHLQSSTAQQPVFLLENTNADNDPPFIGFHKNSASPADNDNVGRISFYSDNSSGTKKEIANIRSLVSDVTNTDEAGKLQMEVMVDGLLKEMININGYNGAVGQGVIVINEEAQDMDFRIEAVGVNSALFVQGSDGYVGIGTASPTSLLTLGSGGMFDIIGASISHGITGWAPTNVGGRFYTSATLGGLTLEGYSDDAGQSGITVFGVIGVTDPTDTTPAIVLKGMKKNTTAPQNLADTETVLLLTNYSTDLVTVLGNGEATFAGDVVVSGLTDLSGASAGQIKFPATQNASADVNTLDDYKEGTWTGVISDGTNNATMNLTTGVYTKIGNVVTIQGQFSTTSLGSVSGGIRLTGLPYNCSATQYASVSVGFASGLNITAGQSITGYIQTGDNYINLLLWDATSGITGLQDTEWTANGNIIVSATYITS